MKCNQCGAENPHGALFCASCGSPLRRKESLDREPLPAGHTVPCRICGVENLSADRYCRSCGGELRGFHAKHRSHQRHHSREKRREARLRGLHFRWTPATIAIVLIGGVVVFIGFMELAVKKPPLPPVRFIETRSGDSVLEATVYQVASKFVCSCGTCGEKPLETCTCDRAAQERQFIRTALQAGQTLEQVIAAVDATYGWMKPEYAAMYDSASTIKNRLNAAAGANVGQRPVAPLVAGKGLHATIATVADSAEIYSYFRCPCGQCSVEELKDCTCTHPRGAKEVKAFVRAKIAEGTYTIAQIVEIIAAAYGGRKF